MKSVLRAALVIVLLAFAATPKAHAQASVNVDVDVDLGSFVILYCYSDVHVDVTGAALAGLFAPTALAGTPQLGATPYGLQNTTAQTVTGTVAGSTITATLTEPSAAGAPTLNAVNLDLANVCAVRGLLAAGRTVALSVAVDGGAPQSLASGASSISVTGASITAPAAAIPATSLGLGSGQVVPVTVRMALDLTGVTLAGLHSYGAVADEILTVTANIL